MIPVEKYTDAEHDADTVPSGICSVPPAPPVPVVTARRRLRLIGWATAAFVATLLLAICIATTVSFLVDYAEYFAADYAASVVLASMALGVYVTLVAVKVRGMR